MGEKFLIGLPLVAPGLVQYLEDPWPEHNILVSCVPMCILGQPPSDKPSECNAQQAVQRVNESLSSMVVNLPYTHFLFPRSQELFGGLPGLGPKASDGPCAQKFLLLFQPSDM